MKFHVFIFKFKLIKKILFFFSRSRSRSIVDCQEWMQIPKNGQSFHYISLHQFENVAGITAHCI